jgi:opacity protein-like surface antigen
MKHLKKLLWGMSLLTASTTAALTLNVASANAQAAYGSYVGVGGSFGSGGEDRQGQTAGVIAFRYKLLEVPISLRAQAFLNSDGAAIVPTVSYDIPTNWQTDAYVGAGVSLAAGDTPIGDKPSFAIQPGIDYSLPNSKLVLGKSHPIMV